MGLIIPGCETFCGKCYCNNYEDPVIRSDEAVGISYGTTYCCPDSRIRLTFDSLYGDGRCPIGLYCIWEGNARVHFTLEDKKDGTSEFILNTFSGELTDTTIHGVRIELINLEPYPVVDVDYQPKHYTAIVHISD